ncbi:MAG: glycosyltransferase [Anaerolineales bacterium]|nr:glycosyltransferase [Anaerolineales bacterium]
MNLVSIIIPSFNQASYLGEALQSVLAQTYQQFEAIVVDDGSTDNTPEIARSFTDARIRYVRQKNLGLSAARNTGLQHAQGNFLAYLDSDDQFLPRKLEILVAEMTAHPELGLVAGQSIPIDEMGNKIGSIFATPLRADPSQLLLGNPLHVGSVLVRRDWQIKAGFFDESLRSYEDWDMWLRLLRLGCPMGWVDNPVSLYRFHRQQMTRIGSQMTAATFAVLDKTYSDPTLPEDWRRLRKVAYSCAHLRAMAQCFHAYDFAQAQHHLCEAVRLDPLLSSDEGHHLASKLASLANSPKNPDPPAFLELIYSNLPSEFNALRNQRKSALANFSVEIGFDAHAQGDRVLARSAMLRAIRHQPTWLANRGVTSVLLRTLIA